jgi:hypothetical protein
MGRFINSDHRNMANELDSEMAALGFVDDGTGNYVPAPNQQPVRALPAPVNEPRPQPDADLTQVNQSLFPLQPTPTPQVQHDWAKREADARQAQRELSLEREAMLQERQLMARERAEAMATIQALNEQKLAIQTQATNIPLVQQQVLTPEFKAEYPDIAEAIERAFAANQAEISRLRQERQEEQNEKAYESETNRRKLFLDEVRRAHRDYDAIIASDLFKQWVSTQNRSTKLVLEETFNISLGYEPTDLVDVISRFKKTLNPTHPTPQVPEGLMGVDPANRGLDNPPPTGPDTFVFTLDEMRDSQLIDKWMNDPNHKKNRKLAMDRYDAAWERSVAFYNRNR